ncbi:hypothetical protein CASFOL_031385 [Castilleja foliolosa]|uniref:Gnk2-homologous domain-containing protein n=1 Tax=Castilleja foliolosa TaxID=1961234 RepID=A0ABD3C592_9LAMI
MCYYNINLPIILIISSLLLIPTTFSKDGFFDCSLSNKSCSDYYSCSSTRGTYNLDSNYSQSLAHLIFYDLCQNISSTTYHRIASWAVDNITYAYGRAICNTDVLENCTTCLAKASIRLLYNYCIGSREAVIKRQYSYASCQLKYTDLKNTTN